MKHVAASDLAAPVKVASSAAPVAVAVQKWQTAFERREKTQRIVALTLFGLAYAALMTLIVAPHLFRAG